MENIIKNGVLVFHYNNGMVRTTNVKVNMKNKRVYGFDIMQMFDGIKILNNEYLVIDGEKYRCTGTSNDWRTKYDFWYNDK